MTCEICYFLKRQPTFSQSLLSFLFINETLLLDNLKTRTATNASLSVFVICVGAMLYLLLYKLHDSTFTIVGFRFQNFIFTRKISKQKTFWASIRMFNMQTSVDQIWTSALVLPVNWSWGIRSNHQEVFCEKNYFKIICKIHRKLPVPECLLSGSCRL